MTMYGGRSYGWGGHGDRNGNHDFFNSWDSGCGDRDGGRDWGRGDRHDARGERDDHDGRGGRDHDDRHDDHGGRGGRGRDDERDDHRGDDRGEGCGRDDDRGHDHGHGHDHGEGHDDHHGGHDHGHDHGHDESEDDSPEGGCGPDTPDLPEEPEEEAPEEDGDAPCTAGYTLDLTEEGPLQIINQTVDPETGLMSGSVEYLDEDGNAVAIGSFEGVSDIIMPDDEDPLGPDGEPREIDYVTDSDEPWPEDLPPKASLEDLLTQNDCPEDMPAADESEVDMAEWEDEM